MQKQTSLEDESSVCLSVCLSVRRRTAVGWQLTADSKGIRNKYFVHILTLLSETKNQLR